MAGVLPFLSLLWGTVIHRPYVYAFFACFLFFAIPHLRARGTAAWTVLAYGIAFGSEYSSTRNGFPFGFYRYFDGTRAHELWISNIPFWDSLSFVFLSYFSWRLAGALLVRGGPSDGRPQSGTPASRLLDPAAAILAGGLMMLLDVVIDPLTLLGDHWFLGTVYDYPTGGTYFGVTLANFAGWFFVGAAIVFAFQCAARAWGFLRRRSGRSPSSISDWGVFVVYGAVLFFNLAITGWIGAWKLLAASSVVSAMTLGACLRVLTKEARD